MKHTTEIQNFFDRLAQTWDAHNHVDSKKLRSMLTVAGLKKQGRILDIGCGTGILFPYLLEAAPSRIDAIDLSCRMVAIAKAKNSDERIHVRQADFYELPAVKAYDTAVIYNAYPHFLDKFLFAEKLCELLIPGGRFMILHGSGRETINHVHTGGAVSAVSAPLRPCADESRLLSHYFEIDIRVDTDDCYILSGTSRQAVSARYLSAL